MLVYQRVLCYLEDPFSGCMSLCIHLTDGIGDSHALITEETR